MKKSYILYGIAGIFLIAVVIAYLVVCFFCAIWCGDIPAFPHDFPWNASKYKKKEGSEPETFDEDEADDVKDSEDIES